MFKRIRDAASGLFVSAKHAAANQSTTVTEAPTPGLSRINRRILANAIEDERIQTSSIAANKILREAILKVLSTPR